ncbi:MAG: DNA starvation/stationary phase protection protein [Bernardetiaceae bacterium]|nr:DNA starvation/stationary phase protection protein [Bernardetiaceae bacterium]
MNDTMIALNRIALNEDKAAEIANKLNHLLADYHLYYQNLRAFHWNIQGKDFFELHDKFEELYTEANTNIDVLAERILTLGHTPIHTLEDFISHAEIKSHKGMKNGEETVKATVTGLAVLLRKEREILEIADVANDEGTLDMVSEFIGSQEKTVWMLSAWLG